MGKTRLNVTDHLEAMLRYARTLTRGHAAAAEDLVSEALVKALEQEASFRPGGNLRAWLFSILHNAHVDGLRTTSAEMRRAEGLALVQPAAAGPDQDGHVRLRQVRDAFFQLPDDQREALHLVTIDGLSYPEAAGVLGIPLGTLMSRLGRARAALRAWEDGPADRRPALKIVGGRDGD